MATTQLVWLCVGFGNRDPGFENSREFVTLFISRFSEKNSREYLDYVTNLKILYEILHFVLRKQKFVYTAYSVEQEWANFLRGGPHFKKMLQPRAAHSHYKVGKFIQCANNRIFILQTIFICHTRYV